MEMNVDLKAKNLMDALKISRTREKELRKHVLEVHDQLTADEPLATISLVAEPCKDANELIAALTIHEEILRASKKTSRVMNATFGAGQVRATAIDMTTGRSFSIPDDLKENLLKMMAGTDDSNELNKALNNIFFKKD